MNRRQFLQFMGLAVAVPVVGPAMPVAQRGFSAGGLESYDCAWFAVTVEAGGGLRFAHGVANFGDFVPCDPDATIQVSARDPLRGMTMISHRPDGFVPELLPDPAGLSAVPWREVDPAQTAAITDALRAAGEIVLA